MLVLWRKRNFSHVLSIEYVVPEYVVTIHFVRVLDQNKSVPRITYVVCEGTLYPRYVVLKFHCTWCSWTKWFTDKLFCLNNSPALPRPVVLPRGLVEDEEG